MPRPQSHSENKPDYYILVNKDADDPSAPLITVGAAWTCLDKNNNQYISGVFNAKPFGRWDGKFQLHANAK